MNLRQTGSEDPEPVYVVLAARILDSDPFYSPRILKKLLTLEQAEIVRHLPASTDELARASGRDAQEVDRMLSDLVKRGVLVRTGTGQIQLVPTMIHLQDYTTANPAFDSAGDEDLYEMHRALRTSRWYLERVAALMHGGGQRVRVLPRWRAIEHIPGVMPCEDLREVLKAYDGRLSTSRCGCRVIMNSRHCAVHEGTHPDEGHCVHFDKVARYFVEVLGVGRYQKWEEVFENLETLEKSPIYHTVDNLRDVRFICNCCRCCCDIHWPAARAGTGRIQDVIAPSRFLCAVSKEKCSGCGICLTKCPFPGALRWADDGKTVRVASETCMGCGSCVVNCPEGALRLQIVRPPQHIPETGTHYVGALL